LLSKTPVSLYFLSLETVHQIWAIEPEDVCAIFTRRQDKVASQMLWLILLYPAIYYVVFPGLRYRHPIEPEITILGVYLLTEAGRKKRSGDTAANRG
jgi:hypothetical protein